MKSNAGTESDIISRAKIRDFLINFDSRQVKKKQEENYILLIDCPSKLSKDIAGNLGENNIIINEPYDVHREIMDFSLILLHSGGNEAETIKKIEKLYYKTNFSNIPIILLCAKMDKSWEDDFLLAGATEIIPLSNEVSEFCQVIRGYLVPNRKPLKDEIDFLEAFIRSTQKVLSSLASVDVEFREIYFRKDFRIFVDVSGIIRLHGDAVGNVMLNLYSDLAQKLISAMIGSNVDDLGPDDLYDGVDMILKEISQRTSKALEGTPYTFNSSIPTIIIGPGPDYGFLENPRNAMIIFDVGEMSFPLQVSMIPGADVAERSLH